MPENENDDFYLEGEDEVKDEDLRATVTDDDQLTDLSEVVVNTEVVKLFKGDELSIDQLTDVTYRFPANKIYILGEHDSGKTTILATLFEMFQIAPFHGFYFAGSLTQIGFEKRCFHSRIASENNDADTERTKSEEFKFLHIALKESDSSSDAKHLLISDISGEKIKRAKSNTKDMDDLRILSDATHVTFVIDGQKLTDPILRQSTLTQARTFIRKAIDENVLTNKTRLSILVSKWDLLEKVKDFDFVKSIEQAFLKDFSGKLKKLTFLKIAVRPLSFKQFKLGHGLYDLIKMWLPENDIEHFDLRCNKSERMIDNLIF